MGEKKVFWGIEITVTEKEDQVLIEKPIPGVNSEI